MSMMCWLQGLSPAQIELLVRSPGLATSVAKSIQDTTMSAERSQALARFPPERRKELEAQFEAAMRSTPGYEQHMADLAAHARRIAELGPLEPSLQLQKSWHILHYLLTGHVEASPSPGDALVTGTPLGDDVGYGPARLHDADETRAFAQFLSGLAVKQLQDRVDIDKMRSLQIYGLPWGPEPPAEDAEDIRSEVAWAFPALKDYVTRLAAKGSGFLTWLS